MPILKSAEDAPKWVSVPRETGEPKGVKDSYSGSIKRVGKAKNEECALLIGYYAL